MRYCLLVVALLTGTTSRAEGPVRLRMAAIAPEGTAWAHELHALSRDVEAQTHGAVTMKWYLGGIAGDELTALKRMERDQLDGMAGASFCERLAPSLQVMHLVGRFREQRQIRYVLNRLLPVATDEMAQHGAVNLGLSSFGTAVFLTRTPVRSMADLRKGRYWVWDLDELLPPQLEAMGIHVMRLPLDQVTNAYQRGLVDGFVVVPTGALAFQWSALARHATELPAVVLPGCLVVTQRAFDRLPVDHQHAVRSAGAKFTVRFTDLVEQQDRQLLSVFERQGLRRVPLLPELVTAFFDAAEIGRAALAKDRVPERLIEQVQRWLAEAETGR